MLVLSEADEPAKARRPRRSPSKGQAPDFQTSTIHPQADLGSPPGGPFTLLRIDTKTHVGPLPPPVDLEHYKQIDANAVPIILAMADRQQRHDAWMDKATLISETIYRLSGMFSALLIVGGLAAGAVYCSTHGDIKTAVALAGASGLSTLGGLFIRGRDMIRLQDKSPPRDTSAAAATHPPLPQPSADADEPAHPRHA